MTLTVALAASAAALSVLLIVAAVAWIDRRHRGTIERLEDRVAHLGAGLSLLTDTMEIGLQDVARELERRSAPPPARARNAGDRRSTTLKGARAKDIVHDAPRAAAASAARAPESDSAPGSASAALPATVAARVSSTVSARVSGAGPAPETRHVRPGPRAVPPRGEARPAAARRTRGDAPATDGVAEGEVHLRAHLDTALRRTSTYRRQLKVVEEQTGHADLVVLLLQYDAHDRTFFERRERLDVIAARMTTPARTVTVLRDEPNEAFRLAVETTGRHRTQRTDIGLDLVQSDDYQALLDAYRQSQMEVPDAAVC
ncbi:MAG: hypothetical protein AB7G23_04795 [Vicinamibacterales bacterium]